MRKFNGVPRRILGIFERMQVEI